MGIRDRGHPTVISSNFYLWSELSKNFSS